MLPAVIASACAARDLGYVGISDIILDQQLSPTQIARLFANGLARDHGMICAIVLLAGSTARFNAQREGWNGDLERDLAVKALGGETGFVAANREAVKLVRAHWAEITAEVQSTSTGDAIKLAVIV